MLDKISQTSYSSQSRYTAAQERKAENQAVGMEQKEEVTGRPLDKEKVEEVVKGMNDFLNPTKTSLKFEYHEKLDEYYVTIIDEKTDSVVKEIPSKKLLDFYAAMTDFIGLMVDKKI